MDKIYLPNIENNKEELLKEIQLLIFNKAKMDNKKLDKEYKTSLGLVRFWYQADKQNNYYLIFDQKIDNWDVQKIKDDMNNLQHEYYQKFNALLF